jgi:hypothetical protein
MTKEELIKIPFAFMSSLSMTSMMHTRKDKASSLEVNLVTALCCWMEVCPRKLLGRTAL